MSRRCSRRRCARSIRTACAEARPGAPLAPTGAARRALAVRPRAARYCKPRVPCLPAARSMPASQFLMQRSALAGVQAVAARSDRTFARHSHEQFGIGVIRHGAQASHSGRGQVQARPGRSSPSIPVKSMTARRWATPAAPGRCSTWILGRRRSGPRVPARRRIRISAACVRRPRPGPGCAGALCASHRQCRSAGLRRCCCACWRARRADAAPPPRHPRPRPSVTPAPASMTIRQPACRWPIWPPPAA